ncbi:hypothetical protein E1A91_A06G027600v1 [Gossypium mustelinum]|uniref:Uncharacterized protein n=1 Tax=Gossypium mustelinum TaxID=34275 RepID=A0A5D2YSA5_GOSMU|nr:hypothetical protein E1A91_A06G027600v1 [Gossypium mustelinum]
MLNGGDGSPRLWPLLSSGFASHMLVSPFGSTPSSHPFPSPVTSNGGRKFRWLRFAYFRLWGLFMCTLWWLMIL